MVFRKSVTKRRHFPSKNDGDGSGLTGCALSEDWLPYGIDTARLRAPVLFVVGEQNFDSDHRFQTGQPNLVKGTTDSGVRYGISHRGTRPDARHLAGFFEASLPKYSPDGRAIRNNVHALVVPEALTVMESIYDELESDGLLPWSLPFQEARLHRLDVVRDFHGVESIDEFLDALQHIRMPYDKGMRLFRDSRRRLAGLKISRDEWGVTAYGKANEVLRRSRTRDPVLRQALAQEFALAQGQLRVEARARRQKLLEFGIDRAIDLTAQGITNLHKDLIARTGLDREVGGWAKIDQALGACRSSPSDFKTLQKALGWLTAEARGFESVESANTIRNHKAALDRFGITAADLINPCRRPIRLDFERGVPVYG